MHTPNRSPRDSFEVCFDSLFAAGRGLSFPCDRCGRVDMDQLPPRARHNYLFARALIGRDYAYPLVRAVVAQASGHDLAVA